MQLSTFIVGDITKTKTQRLFLRSFQLITEMSPLLQKTFNGDFWPCLTPEKFEKTVIGVYS